jgi:hypothetical protein
MVSHFNTGLEKMEIENMTDVDVRKKEDTASLMSIDDSIRHSHSKRNWTPEEDAKLLNYVSETNSHNWKKISGIFGNKTAQQCSYRYIKLITDKNRSKWNRNDDIQLLELTELYGQNWVYIATKMPGRSPEDIMQRYILKLDPKLKRSRFDKDEDDLILKLHEQYGNKWNEISKFFPNRNSAMVKNRFYSHLKKRNKDNNTGETSSNYSFSITTPTSRTRNTISFIEYNNNKLLNDCDIDMMDNEKNVMSNMNYYNVETNSSSLRPSNESYVVPYSSPNQKLLENNFDYQYNNVFNRYSKKDSFDDKFEDEYFVKNNNVNIINENENLYKQYQLLESAFNRIYEISSFKSNIVISKLILIKMIMI